MASENETIADIIAEVRRNSESSHMGHKSFLAPRAAYWRRLAARLEAAWKRERESLLTKQGENVNSGSAVYTGENNGGNAAAIREALENAHSLICEGIETEVDDEIEHPFHLELACECIQRALSAPPRNCDLFDNWYDAHQAWERLPKDELGYFVAANGVHECEQAWLFAPAAERKGAEK